MLIDNWMFCPGLTSTLGKGVVIFISAGDAATGAEFNNRATTNTDTTMVEILCDNFRINPPFFYS
jgi:hypothetical protein